MRQALNLFGSGEVPQTHLDAGRFLPQGDDEAGDKLERVKTKCDVEAAQVACGGLFAALQQFFESRQHRPRLRQKLLPCAAEARAVRTPVEQRAPEFRLHSQDLLGERGLAEVQ